MVSGNSSSGTGSDSSLSARIKNCEGCAKRKEALTNMLTSGHFWVGVAIGVGGVYAYHKYVKK